jgi:hypothetical protein
MSDTVVFTKRGLKTLTFNEATRQFDESEVEFSLIHLADLCMIEPGVTLGDMFTAIRKHKDLLAFISFYSTCPEIEAFLIQAKLPPSPAGEKWAPDDYIEIFKEVDVSHDYIDMFCDWHAVFKWKDNAGVHDEYAALSYEPMNDIANLSVRLNEEVTFRQIGTPPENQMIRQGLKTTFTLLDVLNTIFEDISWHDTPEGNAEFKAECAKQAEEFMMDLKLHDKESFEDETLEEAVARHNRECRLPRTLKLLRGKARYDKLEEWWSEGIIAEGEYNYLKDVLDGKEIKDGVFVGGIVTMALPRPKCESGAGEQQ